MSARYQVQRRLPGAQGQNGGWMDEGTAEASSASDAVAQIAAECPNHFLGGDFRAAPMPAWEIFRPRVHETRTREIEMRPAFVCDVDESGGQA